MKYRQLSGEERSAPAPLRLVGLKPTAVARELGRHRSTVGRELRRRHIWGDLRSGGTLHEHLRGARKSGRKRYGRYVSRGRQAGKRMIWERPGSVERRRQRGHWEIDTMMGESQGESSHRVLTLVERKSGYLMIGKLQARTAAETNRALLGLLARQVEALHPVKFYFATPHHSWERGTN